MSEKEGSIIFQFSVGVGPGWGLKILGLCDQGLISSNWELLNLFLPRSQFEQEIVWLIGTYVDYVWTKVFFGDSEMKVEEFFGFLKFKYKNSGSSLGQIPGLGQSFLRESDGPLVSCDVTNSRWRWTWKGCLLTFDMGMICFWRLYTISYCIVSFKKNTITSVGF